MMIFDVQGMTCGGCARAVTGAVKALDPGAEVSVDLPARTVTVNGSADATQIESVLTEAGYPAKPRA